MANNKNIYSSDIIQDKFLGTTAMVEQEKLAGFEPGRSSDFILQVIFTRPLYDLNGNLVASAETATETLALSLRDFTGPHVSVEAIPIRYGNGVMNYAGVVNYDTSPITFNDYIGRDTEAILLAWFSECHNIKNQKTGFKAAYAHDAYLYKYAPNGTRILQWKMRNCWINEYGQGQFSKVNPELRQFSTTIYHDGFEPVNLKVPRITETGIHAEYDQRGTDSYLGTQDTK